MKHFCQIIATVIMLCGNSAYASDSMKQFQDNLEKITHESTASSTVAIVRGGKVFKTSSKQANDDTQFYIGSVTKHMTAYMMLASLHEKYPGTPLQELLTKKLNVLFPDSAFLKSIGKAWISEISLLDLLTHRSGLAIISIAMVMDLQSQKPSTNQSVQLNYSGLFRLMPAKSIYIQTQIICSLES